MRLSQIEKYIRDYGNRIKELEKSIEFLNAHNKIVPEKKIEEQDKLLSIPKKEVAPISTKQGQEQRDEIREKVLEKERKTDPQTVPIAKPKEIVKPVEASPDKTGRTTRSDVGGSNEWNF